MTTRPKAWTEKRAKRVVRREGYSLKAAIAVVEAAVKGSKAVAKAAVARPANASVVNKASKEAADAFARSVYPQIRSLEESGHSLRGVAQWLNDLGVETRQGAPWTHKTVRDVKARFATLPALPSVELRGVAAVVEPADEDPMAEYRAMIADRIKGIFPKQAKAIAGVLNRAGLLDPDTAEEWTAEAVEPYMK